MSGNPLQPNMKLGLQLSCYNGGQYLPYLFASLKAQTEQGWELLVLDNASNEENKKLIEGAVAQAELPIKLFRVEKNIGFAGAHNYLFDRQATDIEAIQLLNDDAILDSHFLALCKEQLEKNPSCGSVSGTIFRWNFERREEADQGKSSLVDSLGLQIDWRGFVSDTGMGKELPSAGIAEDTYKVLGVSGCLPMYRVSAVREVSFDDGLFDKTFRIYKEDVDIALRLNAAGYSALRVSKAFAYHRRGFGVKSFSKKSFLRPLNEATFHSYRNHLWVLFAHLRMSELFSSRIGVLPLEILKSLYWLVRAPSYLKKAWKDTYEQRRFLSAKRTFVQALRRLPTPSIRAERPKADIAVIMVGHNDLNGVCLESLAKAKQHTKLKVEIVICDNGSVKNIANELVDQYLPEAWCLLRHGDFGFGRSSVRGAAQVDTKYYFFLNPDTELIELDVFDRLYTYLETHPKVAIVAPKILYFDGRLQETCRRFPKLYSPLIQRSSLGQTEFGKRYAAEFAMRDFDHLTDKSVDWAQGSALFMRGDVWKRLGGFDDRFFMYFEDVDLCRRSRLLGYDVIYHPGVQIKHAYGKESAKITNHIKNIFMNEMARAHIVSWVKYSWKWKGRKLPLTDQLL